MGFLVVVGLVLASPVLGGINELLDAPNVEQADGPDGGSSSEDYTTINNTLVVTNNDSNKPVLAGTYLQGDISNLIFTNLTDDVDYTLVEPDGEEVGNDTTAVDGEVRYYQVDIDDFGTWELYRASDLDLLLDPDPVEEVDIGDTVTSSEVGEAAEFIPSTHIPTVDDFARPCSYVFEDGDRTGEGSDYLKKEVDIDGNETVRVELNWTIRGAGETDIYEFYMDGSGENTEKFGKHGKEAVLHFHRGNGDPDVDGKGHVDLYLKMQESDEDGYLVHCSYLEPGASPTSIYWQARSAPGVRVHTK